MRVIEVAEKQHTELLAKHAVVVSLMVETEEEWKADGDTVQLPPGKSAGGDD